MKFARISLIVIAFSSLFVACRQKPLPPEPSSTSMYGSTGNNGNLDPRWVNGEDLSRANQLGLEARSNNGMGENGARIENLLPSVYFDFDQAFVRPSDRDALQQAADYLSQNSGDRLIIEGHCDWRGTTEYNLALGDRRAYSAKDYIIGLGISADRIEVVSMGDQEAMTEASDAQMQQDRRADLIVLQ